MDQQPLDESLKGWVKLEDIQVFLYSQRDSPQIPKWNISTLCDITKLHPDYIHTCQYRQPGTDEVFQLFQASELFLELSFYFAPGQQQGEHSISISLPAFEHGDLQPEFGTPPTQTDPAMASSPMEEVQSGWTRICDDVFQCHFTRLLDAGTLECSFASGRTALARLWEIVSGDETIG
jgi:hypothetical protein